MVCGWCAQPYASSRWNRYGGKVPTLGPWSNLSLLGQAQLRVLQTILHPWASVSTAILTRQNSTKAAVVSAAVSPPKLAYTQNSEALEVGSLSMSLG